MRIAVPVEDDDLVIETRTGQAEFFAIFEDEKFVDLIPNPKHSHSHGEHSHNHEHSGEAHTNEHRNQVKGIDECEVIIVRMVGQNMSDALEEAGLEIIMVHQEDGETADVVVKKYLAGEFR